MPMREILLFSIYFLEIGRPQVILSHEIEKKNINSYLEYQKSRKMTEVDFIANIGGLFGLFLGFSILSSFEIIYWFLIRFIKKS